jgi:hypothetical protein
MLTIKIIYNDSVTIKEVEDVTLRPAVCDEGQSVIYTEKGCASFVGVWEGDVYVMNENGKTIADFHLGQRVTEGQIVQPINS